MSTLTKVLLAACILVLGACSSSEKMTPEEALSKTVANIPEDLKLFDGYMDTMDKAKKMGGEYQKIAEEQRRVLERVEANAVK